MNRRPRGRLYRSVGSDTEIVLVAPDGAEMARWALPARRAPDLSLVDALARLQLRARRSGCTIRLVDPSPRLSELLDLAGLMGEQGQDRVGIPNSEKGDCPW